MDPTAAAAAAAAVETPVYRRSKVCGCTRNTSPAWRWSATVGAARARRRPIKLAWGKTVQLAMAVLLMALDDPDGGPILVLAPKPLLQQWQDELMELLLLPSARWNGRAWWTRERSG